LVVGQPPAAPAEPSLLGVDVGFSKKGKLTGMAWRVGGRILACRTGSDWTVRAAALPAGVVFDLAAFNAPLVPPTASWFHKFIGSSPPS
jgi:hypothetical protein